MVLAALLEKLEYELVSGSADMQIENVVYDSRKVTEGSLFICIEGGTADGHTFIPDVIKKGAKALIVTKDVSDLLPEGTDVTVIRVKDSRYALAFVSAAYFGHPAEKLKVIGITGTKGKTTTTYLVKSILEHAGHKVGLVGTIEAVIGQEHIPANNTTPESYVLQEYFAKMVEAGCDTVVMEVSSQGLMLHRTQGFVFDYGIFTNIEPDHIGPLEHKDFSENADYRAQDLKLISGAGFLGIDFKARGKVNLDIELHAPGRFSVYNALCAIAICNHFGVTADEVKEALLQAHVKGRIEIVKVSDDFTLMIDYAHNAMALESLLTTLREYKPKRLVCLFGCGGNRSKLRRYEMGEVSGKLADLTVITSDNPRNEEPQAIIDDIKVGISKTDGKYVEIIDRKEAIAYVIRHGQPGDVIVLAGKGHEDYQEIKGKKYPMDERDIIADVLAGRI